MCALQNGHFGLFCFSLQSSQRTWPQGANTTMDFFSSQTWQVRTWPFNLFFGGSAPTSRETSFQETLTSHQSPSISCSRPSQNSISKRENPRPSACFFNSCSGRSALRVRGAARACQQSRSPSTRSSLPCWLWCSRSSNLQFSSQPCVGEWHPAMQNPALLHVIKLSSQQHVD